MSLEKIIEVDLVEIVGSNIVQVRTATKIMEDGKELSVAFHRHCVNPGDDYSGEADKVKAICSAVHTPAAIAEYQAFQAAQQAAMRADRPAPSSAEQLPAA